jgi:hypothetical protein
VERACRKDSNSKAWMTDPIPKLIDSHCPRSSKDGDRVIWGMALEIKFI